MNYNKIIKIECTDYASSNLLPLLKELKLLGGVGASRKIEIKEWRGNSNFYFDGDGASQIKSIILNESEVQCE